MTASPRSNAATPSLAEDVAAMEPTEDDVTPIEPQSPTGRDQRRWLRLRANVALVATTLAGLAVIVLLPLAVSSLLNQLQEADSAPAYDLLTGRLLDPDRQTIAPLDATYANIDIAAIDEATRAATIVVAGNRICQADCPDVRLTLFSLAALGSLARGLPPSASFTVPGQTGPISATLQLPVAGDPQRYPFDAYTLILGIASREQSANGNLIPITKARLAATTELTVSSSVSSLRMNAPALADNAHTSSSAGGAPYLSVLRLGFTRPAYVPVLILLLVLLIIASGFIALFTLGLADLFRGIGSFVLVIWGTRAIVIQGNLPVLTIVDAALASVILLLLLGLAIRAALNAWRQAKAARS